MSTVVRAPPLERHVPRRLGTQAVEVGIRTCRELYRRMKQAIKSSPLRQPSTPDRVDARPVIAVPRQQPPPPPSPPPANLPVNATPTSLPNSRPPPVIVAPTRSTRRHWLRHTNGDYWQVTNIRERTLAQRTADPADAYHDPSMEPPPVYEDPPTYTS